MKMKKKLGIVMAVMLVMVFVFSACGKDDNNQDTLTVTISPVSAEMYVGETLDLTATVSDANAVLDWSSSRRTVVSVSATDKTATAVAVTEGTASIIIKVDGEEKARCEITVTKRPVKLAVTLPTGKLVFKTAGQQATIRAAIYDTSIKASDLKWKSDNEQVVSITAQNEIAQVKSLSAGTATVSVKGKNADGEEITASCTVSVLSNDQKYEISPADLVSDTYYVYKADGTKSAESYYGLSQALNVILSDDSYGVNSYITTEDNLTDKVYTHSQEAYNYLFLTRSRKYGGFNNNDNVTDGLAKYWTNWSTALSLYNNSDANMLQLNQSFAKSWYYRKTDIVKISGGSNVNNASAGYRDSLYNAAGAGLNYITWADDRAYNFTDVELNYDLGSSYITPSMSDQSIFAEIYLRVIFSGDSENNRMKYYGAYFDAGTTAETDLLEDGAERYWYAYEGTMAYSAKNGTTYPFASKIDKDMDNPIGVATWNKAEGRWESDDLKIKLEVKYNFSDDNNGENFSADYVVSGTQDGNTITSSYTTGGDAVLNRTYTRFTYGVSLTPNAKLSETQSNTGYVSGFNLFDEVPDIHNRGTWTGLIQENVIGHIKGGAEKSMSYYNPESYQYIGIWGSDVCKCTTDDATQTTTINFDFK